VAEAIVRAVRTNPAVLPVAPEAHVAHAMSKLSPAVLRRIARLDPERLAR
jgi:hypothetical protein